MKIKPIDYHIASYKTGAIVGYSTEDIINKLGFKPNVNDDPGKVESSWCFEVDGEECAIWDWKGSQYHKVFSTFGPSEIFANLFPCKA